MDHELSKAEEKTYEQLRPLVKQRVRLSVALSVFLLVVYVGYGSLLSTHRDIAGIPVWGEATLVIVASIGVILLGLISSGYYIWWCRKHLDPKLKNLNADRATADDGGKS